MTHVNACFFRVFRKKKKSLYVSKGSKSYKSLFFLETVKSSYIQHGMYDDSTFCKQTENIFFKIQNL